MSLIGPLRAVASRIVGLYPDGFRARYGDEAVEELVRAFERRSTETGLARATTQAVADLWDLLVCAFAERRREGAPSHAPNAAAKGQLMNGIVRDVSFALRVFRKQPWFAALVVFTLALGIGATTTMFSVVHSVILSQLPFSDPDRLVLVFETDRYNNTAREGTSGPDYHDFLERQDVFSGIAAWTSRNPTVNDEFGDAARLNQVLVTQDFFDVLGWAPERGRVFLESEDRPGGANVVILSNAMWTERYGADPRVIGETISLDGVPYEIVGVMPRLFEFNAGTDIWTPLQYGPTTSARGRHDLLVIARLGAGESVRTANASMNRIMAALEQEYPDDNIGRGANVMRLDDAFVGGVRPALWTLMGAVAVLLLITCANVANLLFARGAVRSREVAVRSALGAGRWRLTRQLLTESVVLAVAGGGIGVALSFGAIAVVRSLNVAALPRLEEIRVDPAVLGFALVVTVLTGIVFGLVPSIQSSKTNLHSVMGQGGRTLAAGTRAMRNSLAVAQIALAFVLIAGAGLMVKSISRLNSVDPGFSDRGVGMLSVSLPTSRYPNSYTDWPNVPEVHAFFDEATRRIGELPSVESVAIAAFNPMASAFTTRVVVEGGPTTVEEGLEELRVRSVGAGYFRTMSIPVVGGREFNDFDRGTSPSVVVVNETFIRKFFPDGSAVGRTVEFWGSTREIVGVVGDVRFLGVDVPSVPAVYPPMTQVPFSAFDLLVRTTGDVVGTLEMARAQVREIDPLLAVNNVRPMEELMSASLAPRRFNNGMFIVFAGLAFVMAVVGVYGVISYGVSQREREFGIRMSLGASGDALKWLVVRQGALLGAAGIGIGVGMAAVASRFIESLLFDVAKLDPTVLVAVAGALVLSAIGACVVPAARAGRIDPIEVMRVE